MHYFLDTNVLIGNVFSIDPLHEYSINLLIRDANFYYSGHVKKEFIKKFKEKRRIYDSFFNELKFYVENLENNPHINDYCVDIEVLYKFINFFNNSKSFDKQNMIKAINIFWRDSNLEDHPSINKIILSLSKFIYEFKQSYIIKKKEMCNFLIEVPNFKKNYSNIKQIILDNNLSCHSEDFKIMIDAHEFACSNSSLILNFITADKHFYELIDKLIINLCLNNSYYLKNMNFKI